MKRVTGVVIKSLLIITGIVLILLLVAGCVLLLDWPYWTGIFLLLFIAAVGLGVFLIRKILLRRKEQRFVDQIISQEQMRLKGMADREREESQLLQQRWKEAIETLRRSHLKKYGNPLYVLPWYLVIGESASGKTTAIKSAKLSSPFAEATRVSGLSGTRNCDWWFFDQAIIIDTAGRYAIPVDEGHDKEEWRSFLSLLAKYRKKEPLNGLIVTIAADRLLEGSVEEIEDQGLQIRARIDELMLSLGSKFPVYVMVTKCDLIKGMTQFCDRLPEATLNQAMGMVRSPSEELSPAFWQNAVDTVSERLNSLLLRLLYESRSDTVDPALILFPREFQRLKKGLDAFMAKAFQETPYQETPILRGIFFSSGRQEGTPYSHFLQKLGLIGDREVLAGTSRGLFLHDFFAKILPKDRGIFAPTRRMLEWQRLTRNLGLSAYVILVIALCGLMSFSFVKNLSTMRQVPKEFLNAPVLHGDLLMDVMALDKYEKAILQVEKTNRDWWIPRFGLYESIRVEQRLKDRFTELFRKAFLKPFDARMAERMAGFTSAVDDMTFSRHAVHLVRRINMLQCRLKQDDMQKLAMMPAVPFFVTLSQEQLDVIPEVRSRLSDIYLHYLIWNRDTTGLNQEMNDLQAWLKQLLAVKGNHLRWLIAWANDQPDLKPVTLQQFWGGSRSLRDEPEVAPAFTRQGKAFIDGFMNELDAALPDPGPVLIARSKIDFQQFYTRSFLNAWHSFASAFPAGAKRLSGYDEWLAVAQKITGLSGPYLSMLDTMAGELGCVTKEKDKEPSWVRLFSMHHSLCTKAAAIAGAGKGSLMAAAETKSRNLLDKLGDRLQGTHDGNHAGKLLQASTAYLQYETSLKEIGPLLVPRKAAYDAAVAVFRDEKTPFATASQAVERISSFLGTGKDDEHVYWRTLRGPVDFLWQFVRTETACYLQDQWERQVLVEVQGITDRQQVLHLLLGKDGYAIQFIKGPAAPFVSRKPRKGYYCLKALGGSIPIEPAFLSFLTKGVSVERTARPYYDVVIQGLPTDVNREARIKPHATHVELQCADKTQELDNYQYPVTKKFRWTPETCGDVVFQINISDMVLTKRYTGSQAFPRFLRDFRTGARIFHPEDFPEYESALKRLGIKFIKVRYRLSGYKPVLQLLHSGPGAVPTRIARCWD